ncbi:TetR/AcrR family transcriptional regulator [Nocardioides sp.]|uniref:TetR/AcrR family transcriptional regulator n=1 Tax=Nocardioides sp. TaxID=35761 RepID=UPI0035272F8C
MSPTDTDTQVQRPRVEGEREQEILDATMAVLAEVGYDRLTMDAVAARAKASKATLYRRWSNKETLVIDALRRLKGQSEVPDTGSLREDLLSSYCGAGGVTSPEATDSFMAVITAIAHDEEFATAFRRDVVGPKSETTRQIFERARDRGELRDGLDLDLVSPALAGIVLHRKFMIGLPPDPDTVAAVLDQIILPAVLAPTPDA